ncbi:MAG: CPCC family cysteine-rich protein [Christensenellales bacterium]
MKGERLYETNCPVCGKPLPGEYYEFENCRNCGWEDEPYAVDYPDEGSGPNDGVSLNQAKENYNNTGRAVPGR